MIDLKQAEKIFLEETSQYDLQNENIKRKQAEHMRMSDEMIKIMSQSAIDEIKGITKKKTEYLPQNEIEIPKWLPF